ncbi:hypothetical protein TREES_T100002462 [Tupaia chinensis]|uniref:Uncharacterized protein n=1 Tax=Tupaia chinensis TaxID=246437 RepID=L9L9K6_TUPCH|nr:hypothetical protein TREES_T100002462 [Tupaia chinensis]
MVYLIISVIVTDPDDFHQISQGAFDFQVNLCEDNSGTGFLVDQASQSDLPLDNALGNPHLLTLGKQEDNQLNGIHIMCTHHLLSLLVLHQSSDSVDPCLEDWWLPSGDVPFASSLLLSQGQQPLLLLLLCLWPVLVGQLEQLSS